jgi:hypothetical protein
MSIRVFHSDIGAGLTFSKDLSPGEAAGTTSAPLLSLHDITKRFGATRAVDRVPPDIAKKEFIALLARYEALGVSTHIMPFDLPILLMCWTVAASQSRR